MASDAKGPVEFAGRVLGVELRSKQPDILNAVEHERRVAAKGAHASGKTYDAAIAALWFAARYRDSRVLIIAPGWLTVRSVLWHEIHSLLSGARLRLPLDVHNQTEIKLDRSLILGLSTNDAGRLQGHHAENMLVIVDEATGIPSDYWPSLEGILAGGNTRLLVLGNPVTTTGYFVDCFGKNRAAWTTFSISAFDSPNLRGLDLEALLELPDEGLDENAVPYLTTRRWVRERYAEWFNGTVENSPLWASRVLGEFPSSSSNALIPLSWLEQARRPAIDSGPHTYGPELTIGIDPAGPGRDRTVATACCGAAILETAAFTDANAEGPTLAFIRKYADRLKLVRVDSAGIGFYFTEHIRSAGYRTVGINVASAPADKERFANLKAERYWFLRERFQRGEVSGLSDECLAELAAIQYTIDAHGRIQIEDKASVKSTLGCSPDLAESLMIAIGEGAPIPMNYVGIGRGRVSRQEATGLRALGYREGEGEGLKNYRDDMRGRSGTNKLGSWLRQRGF